MSLPECEAKATLESRQEYRDRSALGNSATHHIFRRLRPCVSRQGEEARGFHFKATGHVVGNIYIYIYTNISLYDPYAALK